MLTKTVSSTPNERPKALQFRLSRCVDISHRNVSSNIIRSCLRQKDTYNKANLVFQSAADINIKGVNLQVD